MDKEEIANNKMMFQRNVLGVLGMSLPFILLAINLIFGRVYNPAGALTSISATYYSVAFVFFIGPLICVGIFFLCYEGYDIHDKVISKITGIAAIMLVLFPCELPGARTWNFVMLPMHITNPIHLISAGIFFACLIVMVGFQFTKTDEGVIQPGSRKWRRNILYYTCSGIMAGAIIIGFGGSRFFCFPHLVFIGETLALESFGLGFLTKGGVILKDV